MKAYFSTIIPKIQQFSKKLNTEALLQNKKWHIFNEEGKDLIYIFRSNNELLVSEEGKVTKGKWEFVTDDTIMIDYSEGSYLFNPAFMDDVVLSLKLEGKTDYVFMLDRVKLEKKIGSIGELNSYLEERYLVEKSNEKVVNEKYDYQKVNIGKLEETVKEPNSSDYDLNFFAFLLTSLAFAIILVYIVSYFE